MYTIVSGTVLGINILDLHEFKNNRDNLLMYMTWNILHTEQYPYYKVVLETSVEK